RVNRAYGILAYARVLSSQEALQHLSDVRLGIDLGLIDGLKPEILQELLVAIRPAHLQKRVGRELTPAERDVLRATLIRERNAAASKDGKQEEQDGDEHVWPVYRAGPESRRVVSGGGPAARPQRGRHRAHSPRAGGGGRRRGRPGAAEHEHQPGRGSIRSGEGDREGGAPAPGPDRLHAAGQTGAGAGFWRGAPAGPYVHRHRAHFAGPHS